MTKGLIHNQRKKPTDFILFWLYVRRDSDSGQTALPWTKDQRAGQHWGSRPSPALMEGIANWIQTIPVQGSRFLTQLKLVSLKESKCKHSNL